MNYKNLHFICFNYTNFHYTTFIIIIIILFNLSFLQISFSIEHINNNQIGNVTENEIKKVVDQRILYSKSINNKTNFVIILPLINNETIYNGIITYSIVNSSTIFENKNFFTSRIYPQNIVKEKVYSSSLPFVGSSLTMNYDKPFFIIYTVSAAIEKFEKKITSGNLPISDNQSINNQLIDPFAPPTAYPANGLSSTKLLKEVLPYLSIEILRQLPLDQLPNKECHEILEKLPIEERNKITCNKKY
jgi:hypothetical protein